MKILASLCCLLLGVSVGHGQEGASKEKKWDVPPKVIFQVDPEFSEEASKKKFSGDVLVGLHVGLDGVPTHVHVIRGVGHGLDEEAVKAVSQYRFKPAIKDGQPIECELTIEINFTIFKRG